MITTSERFVKMKEMELLKQMNNIVNDSLLKNGKVTLKEWVDRNSKNEEKFLEKIK